MKIWMIIGVIALVALLAFGGLFLVKNNLAKADTATGDAISSGSSCACGADCGCGCKGQCGTGTESSCGCAATGGKCSASKS